MKYDDEDDIIETGSASVTMLSGDGESGVTMIPIAVQDRPLCAIAAELLSKACEKAGKACAAVGIISEEVAQRNGQAAELKQRLSPPSGGVGDALLNLGIPARLLPALKAGIKLELQNTEKLLGDQSELRLDTEETEDRQSHLSRLLERLDVAGMGAEAA